jgi:carbonic anhydrase
VRVAIPATLADGDTLAPMPAGELIWRHDPDAAFEEGRPTTAAEARERLERGHAAFAALGSQGGTHVVPVSADALGLPREPGEANPQEPFAAVLGCSDARVPLELVLGQGANDLFVVRVAGGVPGTECLGSLHYAVDHLASLRLVVVLGHTRCGAVGAAVDAFLAPETYLEVVHTPELRALVDALLASVRMAALALEDVHGAAAVGTTGYREALVVTTVVANAAVTASMVERSVSREVSLGVFDLEHRRIGVPAAHGWRTGFAAAPASHAELTALLADVARGTPLV